MIQFLCQSSIYNIIIIYSLFIDISVLLHCSSNFSVLSTRIHIYLFTVLLLFIIIVVMFLLSCIMIRPIYIGPTISCLFFSSPFIFPSFFLFFFFFSFCLSPSLTNQFRDITFLSMTVIYVSKVGLISCSIYHTLEICDCIQYMYLIVNTL